MLEWLLWLVVLAGVVWGFTVPWHDWRPVALLAAGYFGWFLYDTAHGSSVLRRAIDAVFVLTFLWLLEWLWKRRKPKRAPRLLGYKARAIIARLKAAAA